MTRALQLGSTILLFAAAVLWVPSTVLGAEPAETVESAVRDADSRRIEAMVQGDAKALALLLAPDLTYTHSSGEVESREHFLETISSGRLDYVSVVPSGMQVRALGDRAAVVTGRADVKLLAQGGKENALALRFTSVWLKNETGWQMVAWQSTRLP